MKHEPSLLERAAERYDFGAALRGRAAPDPAPDPAPRPADIETRELDPAPADAEPVLELGRSGRVAPVDRLKLAAAGFPLPGDAVTGLGEEFRLVKRKLLDGIAARSGPEAKRRTVLIASSQSGDGKTFCAVNLALSLSGERDLEVLLIDGDVSKPDVPATLGLPGGPGLVDLLADPALDPEELIVRTDLPGLSVLPAGRRANDVPELLASRIAPLLERFLAADPRRIVLIDSPPVLAASAAAVLAGHAGETLVVVRADRTTEADLRETVSLLAGCEHLALVLNGAALVGAGRRYGGYEGPPDGD